MNSSSVAAMIEIAIGEVSVLLGRAMGHAPLSARGRSRKLQAALILRHAQAVCDARVRMDGLRLVDTRLRVAAH